MFVNRETRRLDYCVESAAAGLKVIDVVIRYMAVSSRLFRTCKNNKAVLLNGHWGSVNRLVREGDIISILLEHDDNTFEPEAIAFGVLYEDGDLLVVDKPPFLVVHPTKGHPFGTLANGVSHYQRERGDDYKIRFINRLDRDTSGVLLIAKNGYAQQIVSNQMKADLVEKYYEAIVCGVLAQDEGTIDLPIDRAHEDDIKRAVIPEGLPSVTHYKVLERFDAHTHLRIKLETGRTHQIRVHLSHIGHPILGDALYGDASDLIDRQALHCQSMRIKPPREQAWLKCSAPTPKDFEKVLTQLKLRQGIEN